MTIDTDKTLELLHNSPCGFSYNTNPSRYTIEQKELVKFVNFIYSKAIDDFVKMAYEELLYSEGLTEIDIDYIAAQLKAGNSNERN